MYGFVVRSLERFVTSGRGPEAWSNLLTRAGYVSKRYENDQDYDDDEVAKLIMTYAELSGRPLPRALETLGRFFTKELFTTFARTIDPKWRTLEFLLNAEPSLHDLVRARTKEKHYPLLRTRRTGPQQVNVIYEASPVLGPVVIGMVRGVADHYREDIEVEPLATMEGGEPADVYRVRCAPRQSQLATQDRPDPFASLRRSEPAVKEATPADADEVARTEAAARANRAPPKGRGARSLK